MVPAGALLERREVEGSQTRIVERAERPPERLLGGHAEREALELDQSAERRV